MLGSGLNLVTTVIGFGMSATFIVFVCARLICGRIRSTDSHSAAPYDIDIELRSDLDHPIEHTFNGLEPVIVAAIPTMKYNCENFRSKDDAQCSICLGEYQEKEMLRVMPSCRHSFHLTCIDVWLQKQSTCPICRLPLKEIFESKYAAATSAPLTHHVAPQLIAGSNSETSLQNQFTGQMSNESVNHVVIGIPHEIQETRELPTSS